GIMIQNFAFQPPFANTATNTTDVTGFLTANRLTITDGFPNSGNTVTNNFAVNPDYRLGYVQIWNLDLQRELPGSVMMYADYNGAKGTRLDIERALVVPGGQPFIYESSEGNSILHAASVRVRRRMTKGLALEQRLYDWIRAVFHAAGSWRRAGHRPRSQRIASRKRRCGAIDFDQ